MSPRGRVLTLQETVSSFLTHKIHEFLADHKYFCPDNAESCGKHPCMICIQAKRHLEENIVVFHRRELLSFLIPILNDEREQCIVLRILLSNDIKTLTYDEKQHSDVVHGMQNSLKIIRNQGTGLEEVHLKCDAFRMATQFRLTLACLSHVRILTLPNDSTNSMVKVVGRNCHHLCVLDLGLYNLITHVGLKKLCLTKGQLNKCCQTLRIIYNLDERNCVGKDGCLLSMAQVVAPLLTRARYIRKISDCKEMGKVIHKLLNLEEELELNLTYLEDTHTNFETLQLISEKCPRLKEILLTAPEKDVIRELHKLPNIASVSLDTVDWEEVKEYLKQHGQHLVSLCLRDIFKSIDLSIIATCCPDLEQLICLDVYLEMKVPVKFLKLKKLECGWLLMAPSLEKFVASCPNLEEMMFDDIMKCTDEDLQHAFSENPMWKLKRLKMRLCPFLTIKSARWLMKNVPNLDLLLYLDQGWQISEEECKKLEEDIRRENWNLRLTEDRRMILCTLYSM